MQLNDYSDTFEAKDGELTAALANLNSTQELLVQQERLASIGQLAAGVAHELNNPISYIKSNLNTLDRFSRSLCDVLEIVRTMRKQGSVNETDWKAFDAAAVEIELDYILGEIGALTSESLQGVERIRQIVTDLRSFSRNSGAQVAMADVRDCLVTAANIACHEIKYRAKLITDYHPLPLIACYPQQLTQVFVNLLVNAAQAITDFGEIRIAAKLQNNAVCISIADTGAGITPENLHKIFDPFFTTKDVGQGTGLGLSIVYGIIRRHGGTISVSSEVGAGTVFQIELPTTNSLSIPLEDTVNV